MIKLETIFIFHRSVGFSKDSRLRKLIASFSRFNLSVSGIIFERENVAKTFFMNNNAIIHIKKIIFASKKQPRGGWIFSSLELIQETLIGAIFILRNRPDIIYIQNHRQFFFVIFALFFRLIGLSKKVIWDFREYPPKIMQNGIFRYLISFLLNHVDSIISANQHRSLLMQETFHIENKSIYSINNYVDSDFMNLEKHCLPKEINLWLNGREYFYIQSPFSSDRCFLNTALAIIYESNKAIIVTGDVYKDDLIRLKGLIGEQICNERLLLIGVVDEVELCTFIDNAYGSIIFYLMNDINNKHAEPNRLYQCLSRGLPVIVGANQSMSYPVRRSNSGVVCSSDGSSVDDIRSVILDFDKNYHELKRSAIANKHMFSWKVKRLL